MNVEHFQNNSTKEPSENFPARCVIPAQLDIQLLVSFLEWRHNERDGVSNHQHHDFFIQPVVQTQIKGNIITPPH